MYSFLIGCIGIRILLTVLAKIASTEILKIMGYLALIPALGFILIYLGNLRETGFEAGGKIWWNKLRPIHGILYLLFALYAIKGEKFAWSILGLDVTVGLIVWCLKNYSSITFT